MKNSNWLYFAIVVALCVVVYFTLIRKNDSSYSKKDTAFALKDTTDVSKIILSTLKGDTIVLTNGADGWHLNGGYRPRPDAISNLLRTMHQLEVKIPVAKSMHNTVIKSISGRRTKVEIFDAKGKKSKGFYVGENSSELNGTFMLMEGSEHPFLVNIPGFTGYISTVFFTDSNDWRSKEIFSYKPEDIIQIDLTYGALKDSSFTIIKKADGQFDVVSMQQNASAPNPEIIGFYLKHFKMLNAEYFINDIAKRDSLLGAAAACILSVTDKNKNTRTLKIYYRPVTSRTKMQFTYEDKPIEFDLDKYYGIFNADQDFGIIQNFVFGKLLVGPDYFYRQRPAGVNTLNSIAGK